MFKFLNEQVRYRAYGLQTSSISSYGILYFCIKFDELLWISKIEFIAEALKSYIIIIQRLCKIIDWLEAQVHGNSRVELTVFMYFVCSKFGFILVTFSPISKESFEARACDDWKIAKLG